MSSLFLHSVYIVQATHRIYTNCSTHIETGIVHKASKNFSVCYERAIVTKGTGFIIHNLNIEMDITNYMNK